MIPGSSDSWREEMGAESAEGKGMGGVVKQRGRKVRQRDMERGKKTG